MAYSQYHRKFSPSTERNKGPIGSVIKPLLPSRATILEIASGTGEHAVHLCQELNVADWWPTDIDPVALLSIHGWRQHAALPALHAPVRLDITQPTKHVLASVRQAGAISGEIGCIICINMIHISPWIACEGLLRNASALLRQQGLLFLYGPYRRQGHHTAPSNAAFDQQLKSRNPQWGVRDLESVCELAQQEQLQLIQVTEMPANNLSVIFRTSGTK